MIEAYQTEITAARQADYVARSVPIAEIGTRPGIMHMASILVWNRLAEIAGIPHIPAHVVASFSHKAAWKVASPHETEPPTSDEQKLIDAAEVYCNAGGFWRTEICSGEEVKYQMGKHGRLPDVLPLNLADCRIMDMHYGMPDLKIIGRPRMTPIMVNGYPVEFRTFFGGEAKNGAVSFYYPQAGQFLVTPELEAAMEQSAAYGTKLFAAREQSGLVPMDVEWGHSGSHMGATIDFMLTEEVGLVMVDAGPGFGYGAHPCCFIDVPVEGRRWHLAEGMTLR